MMVVIMTILTHLGGNYVRARWLQTLDALVRKEACFLQCSRVLSLLAAWLWCDDEISWNLCAAEAPQPHAFASLGGMCQAFDFDSVS